MRNTSAPRRCWAQTKRQEFESQFAVVVLRGGRCCEIVASTKQDGLGNVTCECRFPEWDASYSRHVLKNAEVGKPSRSGFRGSKVFGVKFIQGVGGDKGNELAEGVEAGVQRKYRVSSVLGVASVKRNVDVVSS